MNKITEEEATRIQSQSTVNNVIPSKGLIGLDPVYPTIVRVKSGVYFGKGILPKKIENEVDNEYSDYLLKSVL